VSEPRYSVKESIEVPYDDVELPDLLTLIREALQGYGYVIDSTDEHKI